MNYSGVYRYRGTWTLKARINGPTCVCSAQGSRRMQWAPAPTEDLNKLNIEALTEYAGL